MERVKKRHTSGSKQSEMPLRVAADTGRMSMYATPQSKSVQPSYGKLNMSKPQSGTSERKTTFFGARASGLGLNRDSSFGGRSNSLFGSHGASVKKDPRLQDKSHVQQCIRKLCEFLTENGYPREVSTKTLQSPSTKEFLKVFEFIYQQVDPAFEMPKSKVEEEVPRLLRDLGYPFPPSKSSIYSVGAPHTWPHVLGALIWLIDTVKIYRCREAEDDLLFKKGFEDEANVEESVEHNKICVEFITDTYAKFMQGADTFEEEDRVFLSQLKKAYSVDEAQLVSMEQKYTLLSEQVKQLEKENQSDPLMNKKIEKEKVQKQLQQMGTYYSELVTYKASLESQDSKLDEELKVAGHHLHSLTQEQARLQHLLANQKYTPADIERLNREKMELQQKMSVLSQAQEEAEQHAWHEEMGLAKIKETAELKVAEYHKMARRLKLIPASAENACGHDFVIQTTSMDQPGAMFQYKAQIQLPLKKMITDMEKENERMTNKKLNLQESNEEMNGQMLHKTKETRKLLREQNHKLDLQLEHEMQEMALEEQKWTAEKESVENHLKLLGSKIHNGLDDTLQKLNTTKQQHQLLLFETNDERQTVRNNLATIFAAAAEQLAWLEKFVEDQKIKKVMSMEQDHQLLQQIRDMIEAFKEKANALHQLLLFETNDERQTVRNNLATIFAAAAEQLAWLEKFVEDQKIKKVMSMEQDHQLLQQIRDMIEAFKEKANALHQLLLFETNDERQTVRNNLATIFAAAAEQLAWLEKFVEDQKIKKVMSMEQDHQLLQQIRDMIEAFKEKANALHQLLLFETNDERQTVRNNLATIFAAAAEQLAWLEKFVEDQKIKKVMSMEQDHQLLQQIRDMIEAFKEKANALHQLLLFETNDERQTVRNNLATIFAAAAEQLAWLEKFVEDQKIKKVMSMEQDHQLLQQIRDMIEAFKEKANAL